MKSKSFQEKNCEARELWFIVLAVWLIWYRWFSATSVHYKYSSCRYWTPWKRLKMETFSVWLTLCEGNPPVTCGFPSQRPVTQSFGVFFDLRLNKRLSNQSRRWRLKTLSHPLWRRCNAHDDLRSVYVTFVLAECHKYYIFCWEDSEAVYQEVVAI